MTYHNVQTTGYDLRIDDKYVGKTKEMLDDMHKRKIDMSDSIFVINPGGYIGESTKLEIINAIEHGKKVDYIESPDDKEFLN